MFETCCRQHRLSLKLITLASHCHFLISSRCPDRFLCLSVIVIIVVDVHVEAEESACASLEVQYPHIHNGQQHRRQQLAVTQDFYFEVLMQGQRAIVYVDPVAALDQH